MKAARYNTTVFRIIPHRAFIEPRASITSVEATRAGAAATLRIEGLLCSACAASVRRRLEALAGVRGAQVDLERGEARVTYDPTRIAPPALAAAVERAVVLRPARRLLATLGGRLTRREH